MVAARRSSSAGASPQKQEKAPLKKRGSNTAKAGFVSLINSWARNEATDMSMSVSTACQLLQDKLGNPLFYDEQPTVKSGPVGVPKLLELIVCSSRAAKFVLYGSMEHTGVRVVSIRQASQTLLDMQFVNHGDEIWKRDAAVALAQGLVQLRTKALCEKLDALWAALKGHLAQSVEGEHDDFAKKPIDFDVEGHVFGGAYIGAGKTMEPRIRGIGAASRVEIKSSTRLQCERIRRF